MNIYHLVNVCSRKEGNDVKKIAYYKLNKISNVHS